MQLLLGETNGWLVGWFKVPFQQKYGYIRDEVKLMVPMHYGFQQVFTYFTQ